jgi:hypothetical protein
MNLAQPADPHVEQLIALTEKLAEQIALDTRAFETRRPFEAAARVEETGRLANIYRHEAARARQDPRVLAAASSQQRERLKRASERFEAALSHHGRALHAAKTITEGIVHAIAEEMDRSRKAVAGYGPTARTQATAATSVALNRRA